MGGGGAPHEVPDWKIYKAEGIPELDLLQKRLGALGLKDPWIRNEAWKYMETTGGNTSWQRSGLKYMFRGFGYAVVAMGLTIAVHKLTTKGDDKHGGHH